MNMRVKKETKQQIKFLAEKSGLTMTQLLTDVFDALFTVGCTYKALNLNYECVISQSKVTIQCEGKNNLEINEVKSPQAEEESKVSPITVLVKPKGEQK